MKDRPTIIKAIIDLENRIRQCDRCFPFSKYPCHPSLGKGDLGAQLMMVFKKETDLTRDIKKLKLLRSLLVDKLNISGIYHSYMIRCQVENLKLGQDWRNINLINESRYCVPRGGTITDESCMLINCLSYLLEEVSILKPEMVLLFGQETWEPFLKACGFYFAIQLNQVYVYDNIKYITTVNEEVFDEQQCEAIRNLLIDYKNETP